MNGLLKIIFLVVLFVGNGFAKNILFDLGAQEFQNSLSDQQRSTKYNIDDKVIIKTNLLKDTLGYYHTNANIEGVFNINSSWPVSDWKFNLDVQYEGLKDKNRFIKMTDKTGEVILIEFNTKGFIFNAKDYKANIDRKHLLIQVIKLDEKVSLYLNRQLIETQNIKFGQLKSVETTILKFSFKEQDKINNLMLVSND